MFKNPKDLDCGASTLTTIELNKKSTGHFVSEKQLNKAYKILEWLGTCA